MLIMLFGFKYLSEYRSLLSHNVCHVLNINYVVLIVLPISDNKINFTNYP